MNCIEKTTVTYRETQFRDWTIRTSSEKRTIVFNKEKVFRFEGYDAESAITVAKEKIAHVTKLNPSSKMFKTSIAANFNALFFQMMYGKIGGMTGIELFLQDGITKARVIRKDVFLELQDKQVRSGGCCNLTAKKIVGGEVASLKMTVPKKLAGETGLEVFTRYELVPTGEDSRGLLYNVVRHSVVDRNNPWSLHVAMQRPGFTTYGTED